MTAKTVIISGLGCSYEFVVEDMVIAGKYWELPRHNSVISSLDRQLLLKSDKKEFYALPTGEVKENKNVYTLSEKDVFHDCPIVKEGTYGRVIIHDGFVVKTSKESSDSGIPQDFIKEIVIYKHALNIIPKNLPALLDVKYEAKNTRYVKTTMQLEKGQPFCHLDISRERMKKYLVDALSCLQTMKTIGIIHRDLKPENMVIIDGKLVVIDWGLCYAGFQERLSGMVQTPAYRAPELENEEFFVKYDEKIDIYSLGLIVFEHFLGRKRRKIHSCEFIGGKPVNTMESTAEYTKNILEKLSVNLPDPDFVDFLSRMLETNPKHRWTYDQLFQHKFISSPCYFFVYREKMPRIVIDSFWDRKHRKIVFEWIVEVLLSAFGKLPWQYAAIIFQYIDLYMSIEKIDVEDFQLLAITSMLLTIKMYVDIYFPDTKNLVEFTAGSYTEKQLLKMEKLVFEKISGKMLTEIYLSPDTNKNREEQIIMIGEKYIELDLYS